VQRKTVEGKEGTGSKKRSVLQMSGGILSAERKNRGELERGLRAQYWTSHERSIKRKEKGQRTEKNAGGLKRRRRTSWKNGSTSSCAKS